MLQDLFGIYQNGPKSFTIGIAYPMLAVIVLFWLGTLSERFYFRNRLKRLSIADRADLARLVTIWLTHPDYEEVEAAEGAIKEIWEDKPGTVRKL